MFAPALTKNNSSDLDLEDVEHKEAVESLPKERNFFTRFTILSNLPSAAAAISLVSPRSLSSSTSFRKYPRNLHNSTYSSLHSTIFCFSNCSICGRLHLLRCKSLWICTLRILAEGISARDLILLPNACMHALTAYLCKWMWPHKSEVLNVAPQMNT
jgi:hypothetical protein